jgi:hypothetical protein
MSPVRRRCAWLAAASLLLGLASRGAPDDGKDPEELARKVAEKVEKALKKAQKAAEEAAEEEQHGIKEFLEEAREYAALHRKEEAKLTLLDGNQDAALIAQHRRALADEIRKKRKDAKPGDIFDKDSQPLFQRAIRAQLEGPDGAPARHAVREGNPSLDDDTRRKVRLVVNGDYPPEAPVSTVPASVLLTLPRLPPEIEYRFVGRDLILLDPGAGIIVDFVRGVTPPL